MSSQRQIEANRLNAMQSTGPKSDTGKTVVAQNAMKHGVFSKKILLDGESKNEFQCLQTEFYNHFQPQSFLETFFLERAITAAWRLSRVTQMESMLISYAVDNSFGDKGMIEVLRGQEGAELALLSRYEITLERILFRSLAELRSIRQGQETG